MYNCWFSLGYGNMCDRWGGAISRVDGDCVLPKQFLFTYPLRRAVCKVQWLGHPRLNIQWISSAPSLG